jgi:flagellum-specific peptidoglycan hydrolase FlgJ
MNLRILFCFLILIAFGCKTSKIITKKKDNKSTTETFPVKKQTPKKQETKTVSTPNNTPTNTTKPSEVLVATSKVKATTEDIKKYISNYSEITKSNMKLYGIPASISLAQGILESGAGFGTLAKEANNHFGIKCHTDWQGESVRHDDDTLQECFRKYPDVAESYKDHTLFLKKKRYEPLFKLDKGDYYAWATGLKQAGYATDPKYPDKLIGIIERYELYQLDNQVLGRNYKPSPKEPNPIQNTPKDLINLPNEYLVQKGDTLYGLSKKLNLTVDELIKLNNIENNQISIGQKLKIK